MDLDAFRKTIERGVTETVRKYTTNRNETIVILRMRRGDQQAIQIRRYFTLLSTGEWCVSIDHEYVF